MLKYCLQRLGVDYSQWRALTKILLKKDFRESSMSTTLRHGRTGGRTFFTLLFFYLITGLIFVPIVLANPNVFVSGTLLITYTMFMIGGLILVEYHTVVISPDDYSVLGYQPILSKTFFMVKLTNILFYVIIFTTILALPAICAFFFTLGFKPMLGISAFISVFLANFMAAMVVIVFYTFILKKVSVRSIQNALALFQVGLAFLIYSSFFILPRLLESNLLYSIKLSEMPWLILLPSTWFGSYLRISLGTASSLDWLLASLSILTTLMVSKYAVSNLSIEYSEKLAHLAAKPKAKKSSKTQSKLILPFFKLANEERVVSKLIRNQFVHDNKFKMAVLGILPLTIFYLFIGVEQGPLPNPFITNEFQMSRTGLLYLLIFLFPMMLRTYVTQSDAYPASWIFYVAPVNFSRLILAEKNFLMIYFVLPFLFILGLMFYYYFANILQVLLHILVLGLLAHLFLQFAFLYAPDLPFSRPNIKGSRSKNLALFLIVIPFLLYLGLPIIFKLVYKDSASYVIFTLMILTVSLILERLIKVRVSAHIKKLEFTG